MVHCGIVVVGILTGGDLHALTRRAKLETKVVQAMGRSELDLKRRFFMVDLSQEIITLRPCQETRSLYYCLLSESHFGDGKNGCGA